MIALRAARCVLLCSSPGTENLLTLGINGNLITIPIFVVYLTGYYMSTSIVLPPLINLL